MKDALKMKATDNGESTRRGTTNGKYSSMLFEIEDYSDAIAVHYGLKEGPVKAPASPQPSPGMENIDIEALMQQMPAADSVNQ
jgi:hypothetical protein